MTTTPMNNKQWLLDSRPTGEATAANFRLVETVLPELGDGQVLVRHHYMSLDPYMRGTHERRQELRATAGARRSDGRRHGGRGRGLAAPRFAAGDKVVGMGGWQYSIVDAAHGGLLRKVDATHIPLSAFLGRWACRASPPGTD